MTSGKPRGSGSTLVLTLIYSLSGSTFVIYHWFSILNKLRMPWLGWNNNWQMYYSATWLKKSRLEFGLFSSSERINRCCFLFFCTFHLSLKRRSISGREHVLPNSKFKEARGLMRFLYSSQWHISTEESTNNNQRKNSHILPTGQWYAPSAVINDAWYCMVLHCIA